MNTTQQKQKLVVVLCDNHSHGQLDNLMKDTWEAATSPYLPTGTPLRPVPTALWLP